MGLTFNLGRISPSVFTDSSLNVGIGAAPSGSYKLEVTGNGKFTSASFPLDVYGTTNNYGLRINNTQAATLFLYSSNANAANRNWGLFTNSEVFGDFDIRQSNAKDGDMTVGANSTSRLNINNLGNAAFTGQIKTSYVGLSMLISATTTASLRMQLINNGANAGVCVENSTGGDLFTGTTAYSMAIGTFTEKNFHIGTNSVTRLTVTSGGLVLIGTTSNIGAGELLQSANGAYIRNPSSTAWVINAESTAASGDLYGIVSGFPSRSPNNTTSYFYYAGDSAAARFIVRGNGGISNYQGNDTNLSDLRLKKDIIPLESYWDKFKAIEIVKFKYKDQTHDDYNIGVIAQQVESVAPEFVDVDGWGLEDKINDGIPLKSIYTEDLHTATIKVLQEAMTKIEELNERLNKAGL